MSITYSGPNNTTGLTTLAPGSGSTGFSSAGVVVANTSGQLTNSSLFTFESTGTNNLVRVLSTHLGGVQFSTGSIASSATAWVALISTAAAGAVGSQAKDLMLRTRQDGRIIFTNGSTINALVTSAGNFQVGSSTGSERFSLPSTVNMTSAVGGAGAAAALPATPESYIKVLAPNNAGTQTTLYIPLYLST